MTCHNEEEHVSGAEADGYPHHFVQGPADLSDLGNGSWQFTYFVQPSPWALNLAPALHAVLDDVARGWQQAPIVISEVLNWAGAHAVVMLAPAPEPSGQYIPPGQVSPKAVVQIAVTRISPGGRTWSATSSATPSSAFPTCTRTIRAWCTVAS